jgi:hypothetical protein
MLVASSNENRVWIRASAIDAVRNSRKSFHESWQASLSSLNKSDSERSFPTRRSSNVSDSESDVCSVRSSGATSNHGRNLQWGWKMGYLLESTGGNVVVRVEETLDEGMLSRLPEDGPHENDVVRLPPSAINDGDVLLANEYPVNSEGTTICPHDLITLTHLHEPSVVECLSHRYLQDTIYTFTGPVLLALNPFQTLRGLYGEATMKKYWDHAEKSDSRESLPPHVYSIADASFRSMMRKLDESLEQAHPQGCDQSILVSGESGAGKTVTAKFVMKYLAALSQRAAAVHQAPQKRAYAIVAEKRKERQEQQENTPQKQQRQPSWKNNAQNWTTPSQTRQCGPESALDQSSRDGGLANVTTLSGTTSNSIEAQVLQSNPILESFGNARTVRNDNSSRFGKFIEMQFTRYGKLVGAQIETYLLEKVRIVTQSLGERNYHVFFELLSGGMDARELRQFFLAATATPDDFKITCSGTYDRRDGVSDKDTYRALRSAMNTMKFPAAEQKDIFSVVAAVLHASNLSFLDLEEESSLDERNVHLAPVCHLLGVTAGDLNRALCFFSITAGKDVTVERSLTLEKAEKGLEAFLKATYGALFAYLVRRINDSIAFAKENQENDYDGEDEEGGERKRSHDPMLLPVASIGVLDIFGFESFTQNSFEQICINYCNEALQQQFNAFVLKNEQEEYKREGIEWSFIEFPENQDVLDLIDKRGSGILSILDDQCRAPGTSDKSFALDVYSKCKDQARFTATRKQTATFLFSVHHYAGPVEYTAVGFIEKNRDELPKEAIDLLTNSMNPFIRTLACILDDSSTAPASDKETNGAPYKFRRMDSSSVVSRTTVGGQFRRQLKDLRAKIDLTSPHYVRCLKPNDHLVPDHYDTAIVAEQLRCGGILEAVRVARAGFTQHYPHIDFVRRYRALAWRELKQKEMIRQNVSSSPYGVNNTPAAISQRRSSARNSVVRSFVPQAPEQQKPEEKSVDYKGLCKDLIKILCKKVEEFDKETNFNSGESEEPPKSVEAASTPTAKAKSYSFQTSTPSPSWRKTQSRVGHGLPPAPLTAPAKSRCSSLDKKETTQVPRRSSAPPESVKMGIQMGKTKVFLRHTAFESLERMRSREQTVAATKLNSIFRRFLARIAYIPVRNAFRREMRDRGHRLEGEDYKECKEDEFEDFGAGQRQGLNIRFRSSLTVFSEGGSAILSKWDMDSLVREAIHNPVPRHEWGKSAPERDDFKWVLKDGLWVRNRKLTSDDVPHDEQEEVC